MFTDEWFIEQIHREAEGIRERIKDTIIFSVKLDDFILEHPDVALVCAYYLGTADKTIHWTKIEKESDWHD